MAKQLNVNLAFKADTSQAKQAIMDLQQSLSKVASMNISTPGLDANKLKAASSAAKELSIHLNNAFNAETGNFDLSKLDRSLKTSSTNVTELSSKLLGAGANGEQAFVKLAQSIAAADRPVITLNSKLNGMFTTLKNAARWQISSSVLHGFMGAVQQAHRYAQNLNESLTNIRIVTGQNMEQMSKFAIEANKAAKALSTTTTKYTDASLIYYQQGLSDAEVAKRTEVTIKMANAAGQSAQIVSDQLTAIWNNFYDGSKSLEYYADVMTALGAATASSTDEIAGGLEKFAAIGETIGLSYEYAASALATITSNTRQSEEVVGTALKTIFARIQGLNLGETLDDGTTLNKYSKALQSVGVRIFDQAGELKNMDSILNEMADKWDTLSKAQQVALAQTVAGVRQYTQLVSLMDNWDNGDADSMMANLDTAYNSTGTLQDQADIYAESWEAARDRVKASLETIYNQLLDDDFFIDISNGFAGLLDSVSAFIDGIGGVKTILIAIGSIFLSSVANKIQPALMNLKHSFSVVFQSAEKQAQSLAGEMNKGIQNTLDSSVGKNFSDASKTALQNAMTMNSAKAKLQGVESNLNDLEKQRFNLELQMLQADQDAAQAVADKITKRKEEIALLKEAFDYESSTKTLENSRGKEEEDLINSKRASEQAYLADPTNANKTALAEATNQLNEHRVATERLVNAREQYAKSLYDAYNIEMQTTQGAIESSTKLYSVQQMMPDVVEHYTKALSGMQAQPLEKQRETFAKLKGEIEQIVGDSCPDLQKAMDTAFKSRSPEAFKKNISGVMQALKDAKIPAKDLEKILSSMGQSKNVKQIREQYKALGKETSDLAERQRKLNVALEEFNPKHTVTGIERITQAAAGLGQVAMLAQSVRSISQAWSNDDLSFGEKLMTTFTGLSMIIPSAIGAFKSLNVAMNSSLTTAIAAAMANKAYNATIDQQVSKESQVVIMKRLANGASLEAITAGIAESAVKKGLIKEEEKENYILALKAKFKSADMISSVKNTVIKIAEALGIKVKSAADKTETAGIWAKVAAKIAELAVSWPLLAVTLLIVAAIASLVAIVFVAVKAIQAMVQAYNADAIAAENAATAAKKLGEAYNEVKQEYEDMISTMENYKSARDGLDDLTEGTVEYQEALNKANEAALELIETGNLIKGQDYTIDNGEIIISDSAMENAKEIKFSEVQNAQAASIMANATAAQAQAKSNQTNLVRENNISVSYASLGGASGAVTASTINANQDAIENSKINELIALYDQIGAAAFDSATLQELGFDTANKAYIDSVKEVVKETHAAAEQMENASELASVAILKTDEIYQDSKHQDKIAGAAKKDYQSEYLKAYNTAIEQTTNDDWFGIGSKENKEAMDKYAEQTGLNKLKGFRITNFKQGGNVEYEYFDGDQKKVVEVTQQEIAAKLATTEASDKLTKQMTTLSNMFNTLEDSSNKANQALADFASGDLFEASNSEFEAMKAAILAIDENAITDENGKKILNDSAAFAYVDANFSQEQLEAMGYDTAEEAAAAFKQQFEANLKAWDSLELPQNLTGGLGDMSLNTAKALESQLKQIKLGPLGEKGAQEYINGLNKMLESKGLDTEEQQQALDQLTKIDWSDWDAMEQAEEILESFGATIDTDSESWSKFTDEMRKAHNAIPDFSSLITELTAVNEILGDLEFGSIIKDEDYQQLIDYNKEWEHLFVLQSDGSRKFIGNAQQMQAMTKQSLQEGRKELAENKKHADALNALEESGTKIFYTDTEIEEMAGGDGKDGLFSFVDSQGKKTQAATMLKRISGYDVDQNGNITYGNDVITQEQASAVVMAIQRGDTAEKIISNNQAVKDALEANGYDEEKWEEIIEEAKQGNSDRLEVMMGSLETIATQNYDQLDQEYDQMIAANATSVQELQSLADKGQISTQSYKQQLTSLAQEASSLTELQQIQNAGAIDPTSGEEIKLNAYEYGQALSNLAENYENCEDKITAYNNAIASGDPKAIAAAQSQLELGVAVGEAAEEYDLEAEAIEAQAKQMQKTYNITEKEAVQLTIQNQRMNKGVSELVDNWEDWSEVLTTSNNTSQDWTETTSECTKAVAELVGASKDLELPDEFFKAPENLELLKEAAQGSEEAINELGLAVAETQVGSMEFTEGMTGLTLDDIINETEFQSWQDTVTTGIDNLQTSLDTLGVNEDVFEKLGGDDWVNALNEMAIATEMSVEEMNNLLNTMGVQAEVSTTTKDTKIWVPTYTTQETTSEDGKTKTVEIVSQELKQIDGQVEVAQINTGKNIGDKPKIRFTGNGSVSSSAKQGSKSSKPKKADKVKKDDIVERYKEVEDSLSQVAEATEDANKAMDRLYGVSRLKQMEKQNELLEDEVDLLKEKKKQALNYLNEDRKALNAAAKEAGVELNIDENGFITNYTEAMTELYKELDAAINSANADGNADESETERIDAAQKRVDELKSAIDQYDETRDTIKDLDNQLDEKFFEWQDNNAEMLSYKLELNLEINEMDLENIEYELNKIADDFYKMAETAALMVDSSASAEGISQLDIYSAKLEAYEEQRMALDKAFFENEEISQAAYVEGMKEIKSGIYENLEAIQELDKSMMDYYGNTLDMAADEIAKYTDRMDHQVSVLDHYSSLLEIMGKQNDYKTMHKTLEAKAQIIGDQVAVAKDTLEMYQGQAEARFNEYQDALARGDEKAAELYLKQYEAALAAANEAQDVYLSKAEEWAEALKAVLENKLADIGKTLEEALTGGTSFDEISKQMERANSLQEEYLTTTNKIYETNKMINTAQQAIDKTDNLNTKRRLRSFQEETAQMQNKGKLSKFELEIQQAKYDLLLAEIALEEAQNAKSMVRLQRDSEGNFGYVYTADDQKVAEAEQNALDKENALYNIRLEGANSYVEKYQQTMQEMYDELQDLTDRYHNGEIESFEEYQRLMTETQNHYYQKLKDYSELYGIAIQEDTRIIEDAWSTEFASMTENTEEWKKNVDIYIGEVSTAFDNYEKEMERIALETGTDMASMENSIKEVVDESKTLKDALVGENGLISAINDQAVAVANITSHYASLRDSLGLIIAAYEASGKAASDAIIKQQKALQAINTTNTALKNQSGTAGTNGSLVKDEGNNFQQPSSSPPDPPQPPTSPTNSMITVYPTLSDTGRGGLKIAQITVGAISSLDGKPLQGGFKKNMWEIKYDGASKIGYVDSEGYSEYIRYKKEKQEYDEKRKKYEQDVREYEKKYNTKIASMDTGGYTGQWGTEGKLAMLHQKELVLNADDTQNFLTSLDVLHEIIKMIDLQAINSRVGGFLQIPNMNFAPNEILDQQVHIEASFPGVTDRNEIEEAFKTLVNRASQFANRKNF